MSKKLNKVPNELIIIISLYLEKLSIFFNICAFNLNLTHNFFILSTLSICLGAMTVIISGNFFFNK